MSDEQQTSPVPPSPAVAPADGAAAATSTPPPPARPEYIPETYWDASKNTAKPEFGARYAELEALAKSDADRKAAAWQKPEDVKLALPEDFKLPEGIKPEDVKVNEQDPRLPLVRELAVKHGWTAAQVNDLYAIDAQIQIKEHLENAAFVAEQRKLLGDNADARMQTVANWMQARFTPDEVASLSSIGWTAIGVQTIEKIQAMIAGSVPGGNHDTPPPPPAPKSWADRMYPNGFGPVEKKAG